MPDDWFAGPTGEPVRLTPSQIMILEEIAKGRMPSEAADALRLSKSTVHTQLARVCYRLGEPHWFAAFLRYLHEKGRALIALDESRPPNVMKLDKAELMLRQIKEQPMVRAVYPGAVDELSASIEHCAKAREMIESDPLQGANNG